jgi:tRNA threonylcarbamoyladenosine biosynthesis protein TsaB
MIILTLRTDKPAAEIGLYDGEKRLAYKTWQAHRQLAETIHQNIRGLLASKARTLQEVEGVVVYKGPGSFTGLRIGLSVANALAYGLSIPIVATGDGWIEEGIKQIQAGKSDKIALPEYGAAVHTTKPNK